MAYEQILEEIANLFCKPLALVKEIAEKKGEQVTSKGLRHGYAIALLMGDKPAPIHVVKDVLGHSDTATTEIYLQAVNEEKRKLVLQALGGGD